MKEYNIENGKIVNIEKLKSSFLPENIYEEVHKGSVIACHDIILEYKGGLLLVLRDNYPDKNALWFFGGRINRGMSTEESLRKKVSEESGLEIIGDVIELGQYRTFFDTDPCGHGKGTDTAGFVFFGKARGEIRLDNLHKGVVIVKPEDYTDEFRSTLHPCVRDFMDKAILLVSMKKPLNT